MPAQVVHPSCGLQLSHHGIDVWESSPPFLPRQEFLFVAVAPVYGFAHRVSIFLVPVHDRP